MEFSCEHRDPATRAFMRRSSIAVRDPISRATMPLFNVQAGRLWATGVLLRILDRHFILTAAHVFDGWSTPSVPIHITDGVKGNELFPVGDVMLRRSPTSHPDNRLVDDPYDACVCEISLGAAERIVAGGRMRFLELDELDPWGQEDLRSWYTVFGFPGELNKTEPVPGVLGSNACAYASFIYGGERGNIPLTDKDHGVAILLDYGPTTTRDDADQAILPPPPYGMSGGGIWRVAASGKETDAWTSKDLKLVGIQSSVYDTMHVLRGTRIQHALGFIYRGHEALRTEFERQFGKEPCRAHFA